MSTEKFSFEYESYNSIDELQESDKLLVERAKQACATSYSPYSNFKVGAAVLLENGEIIASSNQESEAYPSGICAERSLLYYVQANRQGIAIKTLAITSMPDLNLCPPCGACRQVIVDTQKRQATPMRVIMTGGGEFAIVDDARCLMPFVFELRRDV